MAGLSRLKDGVASLAYVPAIHALLRTKEGVDARHKAGHDVERSARNSRDACESALLLDTLGRRREAEIEVAGLQRVLVVAQLRIVGRHRHRKARRKPVVEQA